MRNTGLSVSAENEKKREILLLKHGWFMDILYFGIKETAISFSLQATTSDKAFIKLIGSKRFGVQ